MKIAAIALWLIHQAASAKAESNVTDIDFMFPLAEGIDGSLVDTMNGMVDAFNKENPDIVVTPIYAGSYADEYAKVLARVAEGNPPAVAVTNLYTLPELASLNMIIPLNEYVKASGGEDYLNQFYSAMFRNAVVQEGDYIEGFPMMRSTPVLYYNQDMLDEKNISVPTTWEELADAASELTTDTVKGLGIPDNWQDWIFGAFSSQAGSQLIEDDWTTVTFDSTGNTAALNAWNEMARKGSMTVPLTSWSTAITDFSEGKFAMLYFTTGGITTAKQSAPFNWSCAFCPAGPNGFGVEEGGGDFHIFNNIPKAKQDAAWKLIYFLTNPENAAIWSAATGYIAVNKGAYETELMKEAVKETPQRLVAKDQMESYSHAQTMSVDIQNVRTVFKNNIAAVVDGTKTVDQAQTAGQEGASAFIESWILLQSMTATGSAASSLTMGYNLILAGILGVVGAYVL